MEPGRHHLEYGVQVHRHASGTGSPPEEVPVPGPEEAAEFVEQLAREGTHAVPVSREVGVWSVDVGAAAALLALRADHVREVGSDLAQGERTLDEAADMLARFTPELGESVRRYLVGDLGALLALDLDDPPEWVTRRIRHQIDVLSGKRPPGPTGN